MKIHVRLLTADDQLLGWAEVVAYAKGDGKLWVREPVVVVPDMAGEATTVSIQWVDVNVETRTVLPAPLRIDPAVDRSVRLFQPGPIIVVGPQAGGLPPLTVKTPVAIGLPVGVLTGAAM